MPFGIQLKGVIVGILAAWFLIPWVQRMFVNFSGGGKAAATV